MSFDHWCPGLFVDEGEYDRLRADFDAAAERALLAPQAQVAIDAWRRSPSDFDQAIGGEAARAKL